MRATDKVKASGFRHGRIDVRFLPVAWLGVAFLAGWLLSIPAHRIWPVGVRKTLAFNDAESGGRSRMVLDTARGRLNLRATLDSGATWPVAGVILFLSDSGKTVDLSHHASLDLAISSGNLQNVQLCLVEEIPGFTQLDRWQTSRYECREMELRPGQDVYRMPLETFSTPSWWYTIAGVRPSVIGPARRDRVFRLILQTGEGTPLGATQELQITSIAVVSNSALIWGICAGVGALLALVHFLWLVRRRRVVVPSPTSASTPVTSLHPTLSFQPLEVVSYADRERESIMECLGRDYPDPDLSLDKVSRSTGVPADRVTAHVKTASGLLFKAYLNRIRCEAARKLLLESDLPVSEIAGKVGYGSVPHFNRIFREVHGATPTSLRGNTEESDRVMESGEEKS
ncbi:MAG: helix-turn-helix transcriptional regulator [Fibrobacteres bacterium]|jgi:AraC-like DNA-binding protein|nr:helix-turn-helix transcriptional regulator [Fibrobacterota bacterium]